jgi:hypothetical protein
MVKLVHVVGRLTASDPKAARSWGGRWRNRQPPPLNQPLLTNSTTGVRSSPWRCIAAGEARRSWWLPARSCCYLQPLPRAATPATSPRSYRRPLLRHAADGHTPAICCVVSSIVPSCVYFRKKESPLFCWIESCVHR